MPKVRAVIFDCYRTLVDIKTNERKKEVFNYLARYLQYYGSRIDAGALKSALESERGRYLNSKKEPYPEIDLEIVFNNILNKENLGHPFLVESCCKLFRLLSRERFELFPDSIPVLEEMKKGGYPLGVVSDAQKVFCLDEGKILGLNQFFDHIVLSTHFGFRKPDPRLFTVACALLDVAPAEAVYVGNEPGTDVKGAKGVGMQAILLDRSLENRNREPKPDFYAPNLWEAWHWIKGSS